MHRCVLWNGGSAARREPLGVGLPERWCGILTLEKAAAGSRKQEPGTRWNPERYCSWRRSSHGPEMELPRETSVKASWDTRRRHQVLQLGYFMGGGESPGTWQLVRLPKTHPGTVGRCSAFLPEGIPVAWT